MPRIYVMRGAGVIVLSRRRPRVVRLRPVRRSWHALAELPPPNGRPPGDTALVFAPPVALGALAAVFAPTGVGVAVGGVTLIASTYLTPALRRRAADRRLRRPENIVLRAERARADFDHALELADRVSETWPALGSLVDADEAAELLAEALWQIAAVLARREELDAVLAPPRDGTAGEDAGARTHLDVVSVETRAQVSAAKAARARVEAEFKRRESSLRRADEAGRDFIREQQMRQAIRAANQTLRSHSPSDLAAAVPPALPPADGLPSAPAASVGAPGIDPGADLEDHTRSVLAAYRELTSDLNQP